MHLLHIHMFVFGLRIKLSFLRICPFNGLACKFWSNFKLFHNFINIIAHWLQVPQIKGKLTILSRFKWVKRIRLSLESFHLKTSFRSFMQVDLEMHCAKKEQRINVCETLECNSYKSLYFDKNDIIVSSA